MLFIPSKVAAQLPTNNDSIALALADAKQLPIEDRIYQRYVWVWNGDIEAGQVVSRVVNQISRTNLVARPEPLGKGNLLVMRLDCRDYAAKAKDLQEWTDAWEELRFDPEYSLLLTKDTLKFAAGEWLRNYRHDGKIIAQKVTANDVGTAAVLRVFPPDIDHKLLAELQGVTYSTSPIVRHDYFIARAMSSIRDAGKFGDLYATVYGGLYQSFIGLPQGSKQGTDLDNHIESLGVGNVKAKVTAEEVFDKLRSDRRTAIFRSNVAGKRPRRADFYPVLVGSVYDSERFFSLTFDLDRANVDIGVHPVMNLYKTLRKADAHEGLWTMGNGMIGAALWNGEGKFQEKAPDSVVKDHTVPSPHYGELQAPISCISCHEAEGSGGWKPMTNDAAKLLANRKGPRLEVPHDLNFADQHDAVDRIATLFSGDNERLLTKARASYAQAVLKATGPWKTSKKQNTDIVQLSAQKLVGEWRRYFYDDITPAVALRELGIEHGKADPEAMLNKLLPPVGAYEDPRVAALKANIAIGRVEWDLIRRNVAARVQDSLKGAQP